MSSGRCHTADGGAGTCRFVRGARSYMPANLTGEGGIVYLLVLGTDSHKNVYIYMDVCTALVTVCSQD